MLLKYSITNYGQKSLFLFLSVRLRTNFHNRIEVLANWAADISQGLFLFPEANEMEVVQRDRSQNRVQGRWRGTSILPKSLLNLLLDGNTIREEPMPILPAP